MIMKMKEGLRDLEDTLGPNYKQLYTQEDNFEADLLVNWKPTHVVHGRCFKLKDFLG